MPYLPCQNIHEDGESNGQGRQDILAIRVYRCIENGSDERESENDLTQQPTLPVHTTAQLLATAADRLESCPVFWHFKWQCSL